MGDDDKVSPLYLEQFAKYIEKYPQINVFHCRTAIIDQQSNIIDLSEGWPEWESMLDNIYHRMKIEGFNLFRTLYIEQAS